MIEYKWEDTIENIDPKTWNLIFNYEVIKSHAFFLSMEKSNLPEVAMFYLLVYNRDEVLSIIPCFSYKMDISVLAPKWIKRLVNGLRKPFKGFLYADILGVGAIAATCEEHIGIKHSVSLEIKNQVIDIINSQIQKKAEVLRANFVMIKEVPHHRLKFIKSIFHNYFFYDSLPNSFIPTKGKSSPYPSSLKRGQRKRYRKSKVSFEKKFKWELISNFEEYSKQIESFYLQVLEKSKNQFERLNALFFQNISSLLGDKSFILVAKSKETGEACVYEVVIVEDKKLIPIYLGINYLPKYNIKDLYFNTLFRVIEESEKLKKSYVVLGQTSYYPKVLSGALIERVYLGFYSRNVFMKAIIKHLFKYIFIKTNTMHHTYLPSLSKEILTEIEKNALIVIDNK